MACLFCFIERNRKKIWRRTFLVWAAASIISATILGLAGTIFAVPIIPNQSLILATVVEIPADGASAEGFYKVVINIVLSKNVDQERDMMRRFIGSPITAFMLSPPVPSLKGQLILAHAEIVGDERTRRILISNIKPLGIPLLARSETGILFFLGTTYLGRMCHIV